MKMKTTCIFPLIIILFGSLVLLFAAEPSLSKLTLFDNSAVNNTDLVNQLLSQDFFVEKTEDLLHGVLGFYQQKGYLLCQIDSAIAQVDTIQATVVLDVYLNVGPQFILDNVVFETGELPIDIAEQTFFENDTGRVFVEKKVIAAIENIIGAAENSGYPLIQIFVDSVQTRISAGREKMTLMLRTQNGPHISIDEIRLQGNEITRDHVLIREMGLDLWEPYNHEKVSRVPERLMRLGYLQSVQLPQLFFTQKGSTGLLVTVQENRANSFDGVVGYSPETQTQPGYFTGRFDLLLGNLLGTGRQITALWQKLDRSSQNLALGYLEPWVGGWPINAGFQFQQLIQDSSYVDRSLRLTAQTPVGTHLSVFGAASFREILPDSMGIVRHKLPNSSEKSISIGIEYDNRENLLNPRRGFRYQAAFDYGTKKNSIPAGYTIEVPVGQQIIRRLSMDFQMILPVFQHQVLSTGLYARHLTGETEIFPISELYRLGGSGNLRGFREDQFRGSLVGWGNFEYRYLLGPRSRAFLFSDWGYHGKYSDSGDWTDQIESGFGFGLRLETGLGILGIDYGLASGSSFSEGMIHVRMVNFF
ncbi:BamA/TamA family outer membrane protein [bacterium]|nr:BamA/TamA family outer membrane protein [bacterium]